MKSPTITGILIIAMFFLGLVLGPILLHKKNYQLSTPLSSEGPVKFSLDHPLLLVKRNSAFHLTAKKVTLGELMKESKRSLLVNFWATWCPPCLEELPSLEILNRELNLKKNSN